MLPQCPGSSNIVAAVHSIHLSKLGRDSLGVEVPRYCEDFFLKKDALVFFIKIMENTPSNSAFPNLLL